MHFWSQFRGMISDGEILRQILQENGIQYGYLAKMLGVHRNTVTRMLGEHLIPTERLLQIGKILRIDILKKFPRLERDLVAPQYTSLVNEPNPTIRKRSIENCEREILEIQRKYIALLEKHNELLSKTHILIAPSEGSRDSDKK